MASVTLKLNQLQKVEFKNDPNKCNVSFTEYTPGRVLLVTDVPAAAGSMLANSGFPFFISPGTGPVVPPEPLVFIEHEALQLNAGGANVDIAKYAGRIELREFV